MSSTHDRLDDDNDFTLQDRSPFLSTNQSQKAAKIGKS
jgi:hypothetical protein